MNSRYNLSLDCQYLVISLLAISIIYSWWKKALSNELFYFIIIIIILLSGKIIKVFLMWPCLWAIQKLPSPRDNCQVDIHIPPTLFLLAKWGRCCRKWGIFGTKRLLLCKTRRTSTTHRKPFPMSAVYTINISVWRHIGKTVTSYRQNISSRVPVALTAFIIAWELFWITMFHSYRTKRAPQNKTVQVVMDFRRRGGLNQVLSFSDSWYHFFSHPLMKLIVLDPSSKRCLINPI